MLDSSRSFLHIQYTASHVCAVACSGRFLCVFRAVKMLVSPVRTADVVNDSGCYGIIAVDTDTLVRLSRPSSPLAFTLLLLLSSCSAL